MQGLLCAWFEQPGLRALSCTGRKWPVLQISKLRLREEPERGLSIRDGACDLDQGGSIAYIHHACLVPRPPICNEDRHSLHGSPGMWTSSEKSHVRILLGKLCKP